MTTDISLVFDFLEPWGWIAERRLRLAMHDAHISCPITYLPYRTPSSLKAVGQPFRQYQQGRFGNHADMHEKKLIAEAVSLSVPLTKLNVGKIPDPWLAMLALTAERVQAPALFEAIYTAIFRDGRDIAEASVMADLLLQCHSHSHTVQDLADDSVLASDLLRCEQAAAEWSDNLIPCIRIGQTLVSGAQPPSILRKLLMTSARERAASTSEIVSSHALALAPYATGLSAKA